MLALPAMNGKRVVLDTNVCLDLFVFEDARSGWLLQAMQEDQVRAFTSTECREEWWQVLRRAKLRIPEPMQEQARQRHQALVHCVDPPESHTGSRLPRCADPDDQKFLVLAGALAASAVLSRDKALLVLSKRCRLAAGFVVLTPEQFETEWRPAREPN